MFEEEIDRLAARLGLDGVDSQELRELVQRAAAASPSAMETLVMGGDEPVVEHTRQVDLELHTVSTARFDDLGPIATGGMGEIRRVRDLELRRDIAMKVLRSDLERRPKLLLGFVEEAQTTAQLQHPNIVPVHELGRLPDGRLFFLMKEVRGRTLTDLIRAVHDAAAAHGEWRPTGDRWSFRRLVAVFRQVCLAVAYAHSRGVLHRDLKPDNVMVGAYGEVRVMDWGLAKVIEREGVEPVQVAPRAETAEGRVAGTPSYMPPEQAFGQRMSRASDVYSLGAVLYEVLAGRPPYVAETPRQVLRMVRRGDPISVPGRVEEAMVFAATRSFVQADLEDSGATPRRPGRLPVPAELVEVCLRAMERREEDRFRDANELADRVEAWLDGAQRSSDARLLVHRAQALAPDATRLRAEATLLRTRAAALLDAVPTWAPDDDKEEAWTLEDEAEALEREADLMEVDVEGLLRGALSTAPGLAEAHLALAEHHREAHAAAETAGDPRRAAREEVQLRAHVSALPESHPDRPDLVAYLKGSGRLVVRTEPRGATVELQRCVPHVRRLLTIHTSSLGTTPLETRLAMGSYVLIVRHEGFAPATVPVFMPRQGRWDGVPPGHDRGVPVRLLPEGELSAEDCYVPAGWAVLGGVSPVPRRRVWVPGFVMRRTPVTNAQYLSFLDDLVARGREEEALRRVPRERSGTEQGQPIYGRDAQGRFLLVPDEDGDCWGADWPVILVDWHDAAAFAAWEAERTGQAWRLASEWEREKAARGVDGRAYPWGDHADASWSCNRYAHAGRPLPGSVEAFPEDVSPYGVRGLAGNVMDWCLDDHEAPFPEDGGRLVVPVLSSDATVRSLRGGAWTQPLRLAKAAQLQGAEPHSRFSHMGFRLARSVADPPA